MGLFSKNTMWLICKNKKNELFTMPEKALYLLWSCDNYDEENHPSIVVKCCDTEKEVQHYLMELRKVDGLIEGVLKN